MTTDPFPNLLFPTCAECAGIGITAMPDLLWDMEDDCGPEVMKAFVLAHGGREYAVPKEQEHVLPFERDPLRLADEWMRKRIGVGRITVSKGPGGRNNRVAWTAFKLLAAGASLSAVSEATGSDVRTICNIKAKLRKVGALPEKGMQK